MVKEVRVGFTFGWEQGMIGGNIRNVSGVLLMFCFLIWMVVITLVCSHCFELYTYKLCITLHEYNTLIF